MSIATRLIRKIPGQLYLWFAVLIFGASNSVTQKLTEIGSQHFRDGQNPISLCNVLFVGNLCALLVLVPLYWQQWNLTNLGRLSPKKWLGLIAIATLSGAIAPGLIFQALAFTQVNNVVLVGRLEPPLTLLLSIWLLRERLNAWEIVGAFVSFVGVILTIFLQPMQPNIISMGGLLSVGKGEVLAAAAAVALAISTIISKLNLTLVPLGIYIVFRTALGTIVFFLLAMLLYGNNHFMEVFSPFLWQWMLIYGPVIVVLGQSFWLAGLRASMVSQASLAGSFTPIAGILAAYLILGEVPTLAQYIGGGIILGGILLGQIGIRQKVLRHSTQKMQEIDNGVGFKGI